MDKMMREATTMIESRDRNTDNLVDHNGAWKYCKLELYGRGLYSEEDAILPEWYRPWLVIHIVYHKTAIRDGGT
jgi:hypothetical protein